MHILYHDDVKSRNNSMPPPPRPCKGRCCHATRTRMPYACNIGCWASYTLFHTPGTLWNGFTLCLEWQVYAHASWCKHTWSLWIFVYIIYTYTYCTFYSNKKWISHYILATFAFLFRLYACMHVIVVWRVILQSVTMLLEI